MAEDRLTLCLGLERLAPSQWANYNFNSMCRYGPYYLGANEDGIFILERADKDGDDDILAFFRTALTDFGSVNQKRLRKVYLGYETDGVLEVRVGTDEGEDLVRELHPRRDDNREHSQKVSVGRDKKGRYWDLEVRNVGGADFSVDEVTAVPIVVGAKPEDP